MDKDEAIKKVRELENNYNYWFEIFRRSTSQSEIEKARKRYKEAIEANIKLQKEYNLSIPPQYSSRDRAEMIIDEDNETLLLSEKQLRERSFLEDFDKDKNTLEENIAKNLKERKSEYIKEVLDKISSAGLTSVKKTITDNLDNLGFFIAESELSEEAKIQLLKFYFTSYFRDFFSGEMFVEGVNKAFSAAAEKYKTENIKEDLLEECLCMLERAAKHSILKSGKNYFRLRIERLKSEWELAKKAIKDKLEHEIRQQEIKDKALGLIANKPGILQTETYQLLNNFVKEEIREALYFLEKEKRISREKIGNTYRLFREAQISKI